MCRAITYILPPKCIVTSAAKGAYTTDKVLPPAILAIVLYWWKEKQVVKLSPNLKKIVICAPDTVTLAWSLENQALKISPL